MDVRRYLDRIGADVGPDPSPSLDLLARLQRCHIRSVPFENLDVVAGRRIDLDLGAHYEKVVERGRGGFCYELNGLFAWLLAELGFSTRYVEAQVWMGEEWSPRFAHAAVLVALGADGPPATRDGWYLADVGFGDFTRRPLPLTGEPRSDPGGTYRVRALDDGRFETQQAAADGGWSATYRLTTDDRAAAAFAAASEWNQTSPDAAFTDRLVCTLATADGRVTLSEHALTVTDGDGKTKRAVAPDERRAVLRERFDLEVEGPLALPDERRA